MKFISSNLFFNTYSNDNQKIKRIRPWIKIILIIGFISFFIYSLFNLDFATNNGYDIFKDNIVKLFSFNNSDFSNYPSHSILNISINFIWVTIKCSSLGTVLGFGLGIITSLFCFKLYLNKYIRFLIKGLIIFLRSFPFVAFIFLIQSSFEKELAATLIISWFTWLWANKYLTNIFDNTNLNPYYNSIKKGNSKIKGFFQEVYGRNSNQIFSVFIHGFESNIRWSTILGSLGIVGIGSFIMDNINTFNYQNLGYPLLCIFVIIIFIETFFILYNKLIIKENKKIKDKKLKYVIDYRKFIKMMTIIILLIISIYSLITIKYNFSRIESLGIYLNDFFNIDFTVWTSSDKNINSWFMLFSLFKQSFIAISISLLFGFIISIFTSYLIINKYFSWFINIIIGFFRIFPVILLFYIFNPVIMSPLTIALLINCIHSTSKLSYQFSSRINEIPIKEIEKLKIKGKNIFWIIRYYIFEKIKKDIIDYSLFEFININRTIVVLGGLGTSLIGSMINTYNYRNQYSKMYSYIWCLTIYYLTLEIILNKIVKLNQRIINF